MTNKYELAKEEGTVLSGIVKMMKFDEEKKSDVLIVDMEDSKVYIERSEVDVEATERSLLDFIGQRVYFVVTDVNAETGVINASRKAVQQIKLDAFVDRLKEGEEIDAKIVSFTRFGAYVNADGPTGLLKNIYFSGDFTAVSDVHKVGDIVKVKLLKVTDKGRLLFEAVEKYAGPTFLDFDVFEPGQFVLGTIRNLKSWGAYINIAPGIDALCSIPPTMELEEGMQVSCRITQIREEEKQVRGKILRIVPAAEEE